MIAVLEPGCAQLGELRVSLALRRGPSRAVNTIEAVHRQIRKAIKTRGDFPNEQAATKLIRYALVDTTAGAVEPEARRPLQAHGKPSLS